MHQISHSCGARACLIVLVLATLAARARGDGATAEEHREEARARYQLGKAAFGRAQYRAALGEFEKSFDLAPLPELTYNIARCYERLGEAALAVGAFERFLAAVPTSPERAEIEVHLTALRAQIAPARNAALDAQVAAPLP